MCSLFPGLIGLLILSSCQTSHVFKPEFTRSNAQIFSLNIHPISSVKEVNDAGVPVNVDFAEESYSLIRDRRYPTVKKIMFFEPNQGYKWVLNETDTLEYLPSSFSEVEWFYVTHFYTRGKMANPMICVRQNGKIHIFKNVFLRSDQ